MTDLITNHTKRSRSFDRWLFKSIALAAGALVLSSFSGCGRHYGHHAGLSPDQMLAKMNRGAEWVLWKVDATDEQRAKVTAILDEMAPDVLRLRNEHQVLKAQFIKALEADQVRPEELTQIRAAGLSLAERAFNRSFDAMLKATEVLTPEQRKELAESWKGRP